MKILDNCKHRPEGRSEVWRVTRKKQGKYWTEAKAEQSDHYALELVLKMCPASLALLP